MPRLRANPDPGSVDLNKRHPCMFHGCCKWVDQVEHVAEDDHGLVVCVVISEQAKHFGYECHGIFACSLPCLVADQQLATRCGLSWTQSFGQAAVAPLCQPPSHLVR